MQGWMPDTPESARQGPTGAARLAGRAEEVIRAGGAQDDEVHVSGADARHAERTLRRERRVLTQRLAVRQHMPPPILAQGATVHAPNCLAACLRWFLYLMPSKEGQ
jgi:hypothetical protein